MTLPNNLPSGGKTFLSFGDKMQKGKLATGFQEAREGWHLCRNTPQKFQSSVQERHLRNMPPLTGLK
jgi:hypothetical protein